MGAELFAALAKAREEIVGVERDRQNDHQRYSYASAEAMMAVAGPALSKHGLSFFPVSYRPDFGAMLLRVRYLLTHSSGEQMTIRSTSPLVETKFKSGAATPPDKMLGAAKTYDLRYALRGLLCIPQVEPDADVDSRDDSSVVRREERPRAEPERRAPPRPPPAPAPRSAPRDGPRQLDAPPALPGVPEGADDTPADTDVPPPAERIPVVTLKGDVPIEEVRRRLAEHRDVLGSAFAELVPTQPRNLAEARAALARCDAHVDQQVERSRAAARAADDEPPPPDDEPGADDGDEDLPPWMAAKIEPEPDPPPVPPAGPAPTQAQIYDAAKASGQVQRIGAILSGLFGQGTKLDALTEDQRRAAYATITGSGRAVLDAARARGGSR